jgi:hypothetical protein
VCPPYLFPSRLEQVSLLNTLNRSDNMGIQGLARRLEPYATRYSSDQLDGYSAVVDGPALAYYAHKLALASAASATRIPSYADIVAEAIRWLTLLEHSNIKV